MIATTKQYLKLTGKEVIEKVNCLWYQQYKQKQPKPQKDVFNGPLQRQTCVYNGQVKYTALQRL